MRILAVGAGYLGSACPGAVRVDVTRPRALLNLLGQSSPDVVVNCTGKTDLEWCRDNKREAMAVNVVGALNLLHACQMFGAKYVHVGSLCIFGDGELVTEATEPAPVSFYGETKAAADAAILAADPSALVVRIRQPFDGRPHPRNLLVKVLSFRRAITSQNSMSYVPDVWDAIRHLAGRREAGVFNVCNVGTLSPNDLARAGGHYPVMISKQALDADDQQRGREKRVDALVDVSKLVATGFVPPSIYDRVTASAAELAGRERAA